MLLLRRLLVAASGQSNWVKPLYSMTYRAMAPAPNAKVTLSARVMDHWSQRALTFLCGRLVPTKGEIPRCRSRR